MTDKLESFLDAIGVRLTDYQIAFVKQIMENKGNLILWPRRSGKATIDRILREFHDQCRKQVD